MSSFFAVLLLAGCIQSVEGGSAIQEQLSTLHEVRLSVRVQKFEPIPGFDVAGLEEQLSESAKRILASHGIGVSDAAEESLYVWLNHTRDHERRELFALVVRVQLSEPATLVRAWSQSDFRERHVISWNSWDVVIVNVNEAEQEALDLVSGEVGKFGSKTVQARNARQRIEGIQ